MNWRNTLTILAFLAGSLAAWIALVHSDRTSEQEKQRIHEYFSRWQKIYSTTIQGDAEYELTLRGRRAILGIQIETNGNPANASVDLWKLPDSPTADKSRIPPLDHQPLKAPAANGIYWDIRPIGKPVSRAVRYRLVIHYPPSTTSSEAQSPEKQSGATLTVFSTLRPLRWQKMYGKGLTPTGKTDNLPVAAEKQREKAILPSPKPPADKADESERATTDRITGP